MISGAEGVVEYLKVITVEGSRKLGLWFRGVVPAAYIGSSESRLSGASGCTVFSMASL